MSKKLDESVIASELSGSAFFTQPAVSPTPAPKPVKQAAARKPTVIKKDRPVTRRVDNTSASMSASENASMLASELAVSNDTIEEIRKTVKAAGKEVAFTRLTTEEKNRLSDIVYSLKREGMKTTENEVLRIALNLLLKDLEARGEASVLRRVLAALLA